MIRAAQGPLRRDPEQAQPGGPGPWMLPPRFRAPWALHSERPAFTSQLPLIQNNKTVTLYKKGKVQNVCIVWHHSRRLGMATKYLYATAHVHKVSP